MFLSILLLSGFHKLLDRKIYWEKTPDTFVHASNQALQARYDSIHCNTFETTNTFVTTNTFINKINSGSSFPSSMSQTGDFESSFSTCEMNPLYVSLSRNSWEQTSKKEKSIQEEYKIWITVAKAYGYVVQLRPYHDTKKRKQVASSIKWRLEENVVLRLMERLTKTFSVYIFMDNYFTTFCLLIDLGVNNTLATGVLDINSLHKCIIIGNKQLLQKETWSL